MTRDPVCLCEVDQLDATTAGLTSDSNAQVYFFCSQQCKQQFDQNPGAYLSSLQSMEQEDWESRAWEIQ